MIVERLPTPVLIRAGRVVNKAIHILLDIDLRIDTELDERNLPPVTEDDNDDAAPVSPNFPAFVSLFRVAAEMHRHGVNCRVPLGWN